MENEILNAVNSLTSTVQGMQNDMQGMQNDMQGMRQSIAEIKSQIVTKDTFESMISDFAGSLNFITQNAATETQLLEVEGRLKNQIDRRHFDLPDRDFVTTKVAELRGSFVEAFKNSDAKTNKLSEILLQRKVINDSDDR